MQAQNRWRWWLVPALSTLSPLPGVQAAEATHTFEIVMAETVPADCDMTGGKKLCPLACQMKAKLQNVSLKAQPDLFLTLTYHSAAADPDSVLRFGFSALAPGAGEETVDHAPHTPCDEISLGKVGVICIGAPEACDDHLAVGVVAHDKPALTADTIETTPPRAKPARGRGSEP